MKKVVFTLLLFVSLIGLLGCKSTRATLKTNTELDLRQTAVTDSNSSEHATTSERINSLLTSNEHQNVIIEFEEWDYSPVTDNTNTGENYTQNNPFFMHAGDSTSKPPNTGSRNPVKHRKGTITISSEKQTQQNVEQEKQEEVNTATNVKTDVKTDAKVKQETKSTETTFRSSFFVWLVVGLLCALLFIGIGVYFARKR